MIAGWNMSLGALRLLPTTSHVLALAPRSPLFKYRNASSVQDHLIAGEVNLRWNNGVAEINMPLSSSAEVRQFTLRPLSDTVNDLCRHISMEDKNITSVSVHSSEGVRVAGSTPLGHLFLSNFHIRLNDQSYLVKLPPQDAVDMELAQIRTMVSRLYNVLRLDEHWKQAEQGLLKRLDDLQLQLQPLEQQKALLDAVTEKRTTRAAWAGLVLMGIQFGFFARLTWWEYSWDIMEPVTYFATYSAVMGGYAYYLITKQGYEYHSARDRIFLRLFHRSARRQQFDVDAYNRLKDEIATLQDDLRRLRHPLLFTANK